MKMWFWICGIIIASVVVFLYFNQRPADKMIYVNGVHLSTRVQGHGHPVILIHGLGYSKESMSMLAEHLAPHFRVISYDVRGHGQSDKPESFTLDDDANDLAALVHHYKLDRPSVIGFSMGSYIALKTAEKYPGIFDKIVLIGTKGAGATSSSQKYEHSAGGVMGRIFAPMTSPAAIQKFAAASASPVQLTDAQKDAIYKSLTDFDLVTDAYRVKVPVLLLTGEYDGLNPPAVAMKLADVLPDATMYVVPNAGHIAFFENPDFVYRHIDEFLNQ